MLGPWVVAIATPPCAKHTWRWRSHAMWTQYIRQVLTESQHVWIAQSKAGPHCGWPKRRRGHAAQKVGQGCGAPWHGACTS